VIAPARLAAYEILMAVDGGRADLPTATAAARPKLRDERDRALTAQIAAGVQRWRGAIDHIVVEIAKRPIERLDTEIVVILRSSAYQLLHLTRVPASAVVDDAVDLARKAGKTSAAGFVNAVLRSLSRQRKRLSLPARPVDAGDREAALDYLSITLSHPRWLAARWLDRFGLDAAEAWMRFDNAAAPVTLRTNRLRTSAAELIARLDREGVRVHPGAYASDALVVDEGAPLRGSTAEEGLFVVQDEASQLVALLANPQPGARVLDACAAPGGKTTAFAAAVGAAGRIVACDVRDRRIALLRRTVGSSGADNVRIVQASALAPPPFREPFDLVVVDAPCSGLGTLRRDPDIRWRRQPTDLPILAAAELAMLRQAAGAVAAGGRLVYATCSSEPEENDAVVDAFLATTPGFAPLDARVASPQIPAAVVDDRGRLRTEPHRHGLEAFFGAVFERSGCRV
jgi:16S rRNA (cytosine967-C5)-methyltransferase